MSASVRLSLLFLLGPYLLFTFSPKFKTWPGWGRVFCRMVMSVLVFYQNWPEIWLSQQFSYSHKYFTLLIWPSPSLFSTFEKWHALRACRCCVLLWTGPLISTHDCVSKTPGMLTIHFFIAFIAVSRLSLVTTEWMCSYATALTLMPHKNAEWCHFPKSYI